MKKLIALSLLVLMVFISSEGCFTQTITVGNGGTGTEEIEKQSWYALWGLIPLNKFDASELAEGSKDYTVEVKTTFMDALVSVFTGIVTIAPRTVTVSK